MMRAHARAVEGRLGVPSAPTPTDTHMSQPPGLIEVMPLCVGLQDHLHAMAVLTCTQQHPRR